MVRGLMIARRYLHSCFLRSSPKASHRILCTTFGPLHTPSGFRGISRHYFRHASSLTKVASEFEHHGPPQASPHQPSALIACPGCGALAQTVLAGEAGFYSTKRKRVQSFLELHSAEPTQSSKEQNVYVKASKEADPAVLNALGLSQTTPSDIFDDTKTADLPFCDRCHDLIHHHSGQPVHHPSIESIQDTIAESAFKRNHIYHVLDAADFPLSLVRSIHRLVSAAPQRSKNRRSKRTAYIGGRLTEISFIITRSDLLAPKKEQVDRLMPYLLRVLREALGRSGKDVRLGNVRCVSAKRGWWTKELKSEIWVRGGAGWMLGKVNVGKSNLYETVFPKGHRDEDVNIDAVRAAARKIDVRNADMHGVATTNLQQDVEETEPRVDTQNQTNYLLPPAREETLYPLMPTVSSLPGTTASPIRIPFGRGRGELIDLPGLSRGDIERFVLDEHRQNLVMKSRVTPEQLTIKPGQSLVLGGLVRITPVNEDIVILAHAFVPLKPHVTSTEKAITMQANPASTGIPLIIGEDFKDHVRSAGKFELRWDVTKQRTGPLTARSAVGLKPQQLPFRVFATDILIEGVGWIELATQVRAKDFPHSHSTDTGDSPDQKRPEFPQVEVFSPNGNFIGSRESMAASVLGGPRRTPVSKQKGRPRMSMRSVKARRVKG